MLLLDEPTNHLDIPAREALQAVLEDYSGTILLVSHDRYLIDRLATQIWEIREKHLVTFNGSYREYVLRKASGLDAAQVHKVLIPSRPMVRDNSKDTKRRTLELEKVEDRIHETEHTIQRLSKELEKAGERSAGGEKAVYDQLNRLSWEMAQAQARLEQLMGEWEKLAA